MVWTQFGLSVSIGVEETKDERKEEVIATTTATTPGRVGAVGRVVTMELDLMDLEHVKSFAQEFQSRFDRLDVLVCNAGKKGRRRRRRRLLYEGIRETLKHR